MQVSKDIHLEKFLEAMIEQYAHDLGEETAKELVFLLYGPFDNYEI